MKEAVKFIKGTLMVPIDELGQSVIKQAAMTSMASKILGPAADFWSDMCVKAVTAVKTTGADGRAR